MELLEAADVVRGNGNWMNGYQYDRIGCALRSYTSPVCAPSRTQLSGSTDPVSDSTVCGTDSWVFAVVTSLRNRARDLVTATGAIVADALDAESEKALGRFMWGGDAALDAGKDYAWMGAADVVTVTAGADNVASIAAAIVRHREVATGVKDEDTLLHVGLGVYLAIAATTIADDGTIEGTKIRVVTSPGYPVNAIGVTGPITVRLSDDETYEVVDSRVNDRESEATRLVSLEFDPCHAVRVATA